MFVGPQNWPPFTVSIGMGALYNLALSVGVFEREVGSRLKRSPNRFSPSEEYLSAFARVLAFSSVSRIHFPDNWTGTELGWGGV